MDKRLFQATLIAIACTCATSRADDEIRQFFHARTTMEVSARESAVLRKLTRERKSGELMSKDTDERAERQILNRFPASSPSNASIQEFRK